jgi:hypothetical protein
MGTENDLDMQTNKPKCKLLGTDGNVFCVIGKVVQTLKKADQADKAKEFANKAYSSSSYDEVLRLCFDYVEVR